MIDDELTVIAEVHNLPDVFNIFLRSRTTCQQCFHTSELTEHLWLLSLHFPAGFAEEAPNSQGFHIESLMESYFRLEMLPFHPYSQCRLVGVTGKKLDITNSPQVLVVHISRFGSGLHKIDAYVKFPIELTTEHIKSGNGHLLTYRLRGLIIHKGQSTAEGHFMAFVLIEGNW